MTLTPEATARALPWEDCMNARDLGGYQTTDGRIMKWQAIVRSDNPARLTTHAQQAAVDYGLKTVIDLRNDDELEQFPNPLQLRTDSLEYINVPLVDPAAAPPASFTTLANNYIRIVDIFTDQMALIMNLIAFAPPGGVMVHCMAGKDRTGLVCAVILSLAGVDDETVAEDYALSEERLRPFDEDWLENGPGERYERELQLARTSPKAHVMRDVLDHLRERYGGAEGYLRAAGVGDEAIVRLRARILE
jgi:protein tyrosine/serine phosphatase